MEQGFKAALDAKGPERDSLFESTADLLMAHVTVEERIFYPAVKERRTKDILLESLEEHLSLKRLLADLDGMSSGDEHFEPKLHVLYEQAHHHHEEEEEHLFPKVTQLMGQEELSALGERMELSQRELLRQEPRKRAVAETATAAEVG